MTDSRDKRGASGHSLSPHVSAGQATDEREASVLAARRLDNGLTTHRWIPDHHFPKFAVGHVKET